MLKNQHELARRERQIMDILIARGRASAADVRATLGSWKRKDTIQVVAKGAPNPAASSEGSPKPIRVGGNVQAANLIQQVRPVYPPDLQAQGEGIPLSLSVHNADVTPEFANAAMMP